jgi:hypothetical protein
LLQLWARPFSSPKSGRWVPVGCMRPDEQATVAIALVGICWAIACWVGFA